MQLYDRRREQGEAVVSSSLPTISKGRDYTRQKLTEMRDYLLAHFTDQGMMVGVFGSYARHEASTESDLDFFCICREEVDKAKWKDALSHHIPKLLEIGGKSPASDGSFGDVAGLDAMLTNIGGGYDTNVGITRRILFLLEGEWLYNPAMAQETRSSLIKSYVRETITSHQLALFMLNDIIRYYRTICVDFEFKTIQQSPPKPWGTRNIKLVFSRKLLYFSGILAIAETAQCTYLQKVEKLEYLFSLNVVERLFAISGEEATRSLELYDYFLDQLSSKDVRDELNAVTEENRDESETFRVLKDNGHHFSWELLKLLRSTYDHSHPIHRNVIL